MIPARSRPAWAEISANALRHNAEVVKKQIGSAALCAVVKADGYGHGASLVAKVFEQAGIANFAVANIDEGIELRQAGISGSILCLSEPDVCAIPEALNEGITLTLYSREGMLRTREAAAKVFNESGDSEKRIGYHLKIDTGMHRVGANPSEIMDLAAYGNEVGLKMEGFWTHLSVADQPNVSDSVEFTMRQLSIFDDLKEKLLQNGYAPRLHVANSAAAYNYPDSHFHMVRSGIALYGCSPSLDTEIEDLWPVMTLKARVSFIREVGPGEFPSYGRKRPTTGDRTVLATVPLGYADGIPRRLFESGAEVLISGKRRPLAGTITMDQVIVDCGDDPEVSVGDEVVFIGTQGSQSVTPDEWAALLGTINYEVITGIGFRVPRILDSSGMPNYGASAFGLT